MLTVLYIYSFSRLPNDLSDDVQSALLNITQCHIPLTSTTILIISSILRYPSSLQFIATVVRFHMSLLSDFLISTPSHFHGLRT